MVRSSVLLTAAAAVFSTNFGAAKALFSVHDDILAFPQVSTVSSVSRGWEMGAGGGGGGGGILVYRVTD